MQLHCEAKVTCYYMNCNESATFRTYPPKSPEELETVRAACESYFRELGWRIGEKNYCPEHAKEIK